MKTDSHVCSALYLLDDPDVVQDVAQRKLETQLVRHKNSINLKTEVLLFIEKTPPDIVFGLLFLGWVVFWLISAYGEEVPSNQNQPVNIFSCTSLNPLICLSASEYCTRFMELLKPSRSSSSQTLFSFLNVYSEGLETTILLGQDILFNVTDNQ